MSISALLIQGLQLMLMGMGFVFVFLALLVVVVSAASRLLANHVPPLATAASGRSADPNPDPELVVAITAAIHQHRAQANNSRQQ